MIVWHVLGAKKLKRCLMNGYILPPVRAWKTIQEAERFSKQTGRQIILRLKFPEDAKQLAGHKGKAVYIDYCYPLKQIFGEVFKKCVKSRS